MSRFTSYQSMLEYYKTCRSPSKGKPFASWARIFLEGDALVVKAHNTKVFTVTPDDVITFEVDSRSRYTLSQVLRNIVPFDQVNIGTNTYVILYSPTVRKLWYERDRSDTTSFKKLARKNGYLLGMNPVRFNLSTGECLNPGENLTPTSLRTKDVEANRVWLRALKNFNRQIKIRNKLGVINSVFEEAVVERRNASMSQYGSASYYHVDGLDFAEDVRFHMLYSAIKTGEVTTDLIKKLIHTEVKHFVAWGRQRPGSADLLRSINAVTRKHSTQLRFKFGVYNNDEVTK